MIRFPPEKPRAITDKKQREGFVTVTEKKKTNWRKSEPKCGSDADAGFGREKKRRE